MPTKSKPLLRETTPVLWLVSRGDEQNVHLYRTGDLDVLLADLCRGEFFRDWPRFREPGEYYIRAQFREDPLGKYVLHHSRSTCNDRDSYQILDASLVVSLYNWHHGPLKHNATGAYVKLFRQRDAEVLLPQFVARLPQLYDAVRISIHLSLAHQPKEKVRRESNCERHESERLQSYQEGRYAALQEAFKLVSDETCRVFMGADTPGNNTVAWNMRAVAFKLRTLVQESESNLARAMGATVELAKSEDEPLLPGEPNDQPSS